MGILERLQKIAVWTNRKLFLKSMQNKLRVGTLLQTKQVDETLTYEVTKVGVYQIILSLKWVTGKNNKSGLNPIHFIKNDLIVINEHTFVVDTAFTHGYEGWSAYDNCKFNILWVEKNGFEVE